MNEQIIESFYPQWFKLPLIAFGSFNKTQLHMYIFMLTCAYNFAFQTKLSIHHTLTYFQNFEIENNDYEKDRG